MRISGRHDLFAGEVEGGDCTAAPAPALAAELRTTLRRHSVLMFPNQVLDDDQHIALSRRPYQSGRGHGHRRQYGPAARAWWNSSDKLKR